MRIEDGDAQYTRDAIKQLLMSEREKHNHEYNENAWWEAILASVIGEKKNEDSAKVEDNENGMQINSLVVES